MKKWLKRLVAVLLVPVGLSGVVKHEQAEPITKIPCVTGNTKCPLPNADDYLGEFGISL